MSEEELKESSNHWLLASAKRLLPSLAIIFLMLPLFLNTACCWSNGGFSTDPSNPKYGTHDWIAEHALEWLPSEAKSWILENLNWYLYGTELPDNGRAPDGIGDTGLHHVYFSADRALVDDSAARRANETFNQALALLLSGDTVSAAKYVGAMTHYIADMAVFGHVMGASTDWGSEKHHSDYEDYVESKTSTYSSEWSAYLTFDGKLDTLTAYDAAVELAYDTTFDRLGRGLTCVWMDQNYDWTNQTFRARAIQSLNLAVNYVADVLYTFYTEYIKASEGAEAFEYTVTLTPSNVTLKRGETAQISVRVERTAVEAIGKISLSVIGAPEGVACRLGVESDTPPIQTTLTVTAAENAPVGTYVLMVRAACGGEVKEAQLSVTIIEPEMALSEQWTLGVALTALVAIILILMVRRRK